MVVILNGPKGSKWTVANENQRYRKGTDGAIEKVIMVGLQLDLGCNYGEGVVRVRVSALTVRVSALRVRMHLGLRCT